MGRVNTPAELLCRFHGTEGEYVCMVEPVHAASDNHALRSRQHRTRTATRASPHPSYFRISLSPNPKETIRTGKENITSSTGSRASAGGRPCSSGFSCRKCGLGALCQSFPEGSGLHYSHVSCQTPDNLLLTDSICVPCRSCTLASSQPNTFLAPDIFCVRF